MLRVRFSEKSKQLIVSKLEQKNYFELLDVQAIKIFLPSKYTYQIVDEDQVADICIVGTQHTDNSLLRANEYNIFLSVENFSVGRTHYQHFNKFSRLDNPLISTYIYNDIPHPTDNIIPSIYARVNYFNSIYSQFESIRNLVPFEQKKFCLFTSRNGLNSNKQLVINQLSQLGSIDFLDKYDDILKSKSCYNSSELIQIYSQYKFIICFENSKTEGYITEKIFNVFLSGSVAVYDGAPNITDYIVPGSFIQYDENIVRKVGMLVSNKVLYNAIVAKDKTRELDYSLVTKLFDDQLIKKNISYKHGLNHFDILYFINLDRRPDRLKHITNELSKTNININKINHIHACDMPNFGILGCAKSHIMALENFLQTDDSIQTCMICEDDLWFIQNQEHVNNIINKFLVEFPDWDALSLALSIYESTPVSDYAIKVLKGQTLSGYCVTKKFAKILLDNFKESSNILEKIGYKVCEYCLDNYMERLQPISNWYCLFPRIAKQVASYSDIENCYVNYKS